MNDQRRPFDPDQTLSDADQVAANSDQLLSNAAQAADDADQASADSDQRASDRDQAMADRDHNTSKASPEAERAYRAARAQRKWDAADERIARGRARDFNAASRRTPKKDPPDGSPTG